MKMSILKTLCVCLLTAGIHQFVFAQNKVYTYYMNEEMQSTSKEKAVIVGKGDKTDAFFLVRFYRIPDNRLFLVETYTDSSLSVLNGFRMVYHTNGKKAERTEFTNNAVNGTSMQWDSTGNLLDSSIYINDKIIHQSEFSYYPNDRIFEKNNEAEVTSTYQYIEFGPDGEKTSEVNFTDNNGVRKDYDANGNLLKTETLLNRELNEAKYSGNWANHLITNLNAAIPVMKGAPGGNYLVNIRFVVEKDGTIKHFLAETNHGYGMEEEALRVIKKSGEWTPATRFGKPVRSIKNQKINFVVNF